MIDEAAVRARYIAVASLIDEGARRLLAGLARNTVQRGVKDVQARDASPKGRTRREGAGQPRVEDLDPTLRRDLEALIEPPRRGDPESPCDGPQRASADRPEGTQRTRHQRVPQRTDGARHRDGVPP